MNLPQITPEVRRFLDKVDRTGEHWLWRGAKNRDGYGVFRAGSKRDGTRRTVLAHRYFDEWMNGPIPEGTVLLHECDIRACVRCTRRGSQLENMRDMSTKLRGRPGGRPMKQSRWLVAAAAEGSQYAMQLLDRVSGGRR